MGMVKFWTDGSCQRVLPCNKLGRSLVRVPDQSWFFGQIHFVDLAMKRAAADAELEPLLNKCAQRLGGL